eukprot:5854535-Pyramimonas_sp.AAC.1
MLARGCARGKGADGFHRVWGDCSSRPEHPDFEKSQSLLDMVQTRQHRYPRMWLRGLPPRSWTTTPECDT